jgi:hypothetical protein
MPRVLSPVLTAADFDQAELTAMLLDGEAYRVGDGIAPLDEVPGPLVRAMGLASGLPSRLIAERHSAAWIWGAQPRPPLRHELCADSGARTRPSLDSAVSVREVILLTDDTVNLGSLAVTTPLRTVIDLTRFVIDWNENESGIVRELLRIGGLSIPDCARAMNRRRNLPRKRLALRRLASCQQGMPG